MMRLFELAERTEENEGIDEAWPKLKSPRPETSYLHASWLARRGETARALEAFRAIPDQGEFAPEARYFEGALLVQRGALDEAARAFEKALRLVLAVPLAAEIAADSREREGLEAVRFELLKRYARVRDQARLALGRVYFEQDRYGPAIDRYRDIEPESEASAE